MLKNWWLGILLCLPTAVLADRPYVEVERRLSAEQMRATGLDTLTPEQLALLNRLLREEEARRVPVVAAAEAAEREASLDRFAGMDSRPIRARLVGELSGWEPGSEFVLDNGQRWRVLRGSLRLPRTLQSPAVEIAPGLAGRWFFHVDEDLPGARVYRVE
jgi:hypothetical protein